MANKYSKMLGEYLIALSARMEKGKPVQPPAAPPPQANYQAHPFELFVPFASQEFARTFIHLLKVSPEIPPHIRLAIETWLEEYDRQIFSWLKAHYGPGVGRVADSITKQVMVAQRTRAESEAKQAVNNEIADLEERFNQEPPDGNK